MNIKLKAPFDKAELKKLKCGDRVLLSGFFLTGRDAAHKRLFDALKNGSPLPVELNGQAIYYVGPCFKTDGSVSSAGPTTSMRMDAYAPVLYDNGILATIGKGERSKDVYDAIVRNGGVYFAAIGGAGAIYADAVQNARVLAYSDLGTEAIYRFDVKDFPVIVAIDSKGNSLYKARG